MTFSHLDKNEEFVQACDLFENSCKHVFLTGRAGTGKSTLLQYFRSNTAKNVAVLAPTGVAAINIKGQTIHSFFGFRPDITPAKAAETHIRRSQRALFKSLDTIIIDEISMVRADLLDCIDAFLRVYGPRKNTVFGGVQMIFIGDLFQLPPVVSRSEQVMYSKLYASPYFFDAKVFERIELVFMELATIYRQKESRFIGLLNAVRDNEVSQNDMDLLNKRLNPGFDPPAEDFYVYLTTTNDIADQINQARLTALRGETFEYSGEVDGKFEGRNLPTHEQLKIKCGAQVMLLNNDPDGRWVNGSIGHVRKIVRTKVSGDIIRVQLADGDEVDVSEHTWEMFRFVHNEELDCLESEVVGGFTQYPLRLAWAVTVHKAQGKTFDKVVIDVGRGTFSHGQIYVALSRCTTLEGIVLKKPILRQHIMMDERIRCFLDNFKKSVRKSHIVLE